MNLHLSLDSVQDPVTLVAALELALRNVPEVHWFEVQFGVATKPVSVYHGLGRVPLGMVMDALANEAAVWAGPDDRREWGRERVVVRCNAADVKMRVGLIL